MNKLKPTINFLLEFFVKFSLIKPIKKLLFFSLKRKYKKKHRRAKTRIRISVNNVKLYSLKLKCKNVNSL